jgi:2-polyprenyl-3-methyl-5-hydroxy-6-metoxy-1,4-benzoquinol methylase
LLRKEPKENHPMDDDEKIKKMVAFVTDGLQPNMNALVPLIRKIDSLCLTVKFFGYELANALAEALPVRQGLIANRIGLESKPSTQADIASDWVAYWCQELKTPVVFHRKIWELAYVLQAIYDHGSIREGTRGLGFGCGREPIPSYLGQQGVSVTVTDQAPEALQEQGWAKSGEYTESVDLAFHEKLISYEKFKQKIDFRYVDMNNINENLRNYDFCWSVCAYEHLGSIQKGMDFIENALKTVRPGGLSVHTTEFNFFNDNETIDNWMTVLFQKKHFIEIAQRLEAQGHKVAPLNFDVGAGPLDRFIDVPPYAGDWSSDMQKAWEPGGSSHIKLCVDGFPSTCFGLIVTKAL